MHASTAVRSGEASVARGLVERLAQLAEGAEAWLLAAYDGPATGPLETMSHSRGLLGAALVLSQNPGDLRLRATLVDGQAPEASAPLSRHARSEGRRVGTECGRPC